MAAIGDRPLIPPDPGNGRVPGRNVLGPSAHAIAEAKYTHVLFSLRASAPGNRGLLGSHLLRQLRLNVLAVLQW